jgi:hypothetical protein
MLRGATLLLLAGAVACGPQPPPPDNDAGTDAGPVSPPDAGVDAGPVQATLSDIQAKIFTPSCATGACHSAAGAGLSGYLDLSSAATSYSNLVSVPSTYCTQGKCMGVDLLRVDPGNPGMSFMIVKLVNMWEPNAPPDGNPMPYSGSQLPQDQIDAIESWISAGAPNN